MENQTVFQKQVKEALEHLYDTAYLETHPLLSQFPMHAADSRLTRAQRLRSLLKETIEALKPQEGSPPGTPEWRSYLAMRYRYVQGMSPGEIEIDLSISLRQLQRELHKGMDALSALLWERRSGNEPSTHPPALEKQIELNEWEISRQICQVQTLVDDTLWMVKPLLSGRGLTLQVDVPEGLAAVFVDATLTRQALFQVLRLLVQKTPEGSLSLQAREVGKQTHLLLQSPQRIVCETEEGWQHAQLIGKQQGCPLSEKASADGRTYIVFTLPHASQPRILVIDDNAAIHQLFERYLAPHHYEIIHARSGTEALQLASEKHPNVITLDVMMPNVDGWQVLRGLTDNPYTAHIPIVICSVLKEPELAFSLGARAYLKKPVDRTELATTLARLLASAAPAAATLPLKPEDI